MNCFHCVARSGVIGVCANRRAHCSSPWFRIGRQNAVGSLGGGGACPTMRVHAAADSSNCLRHSSNIGFSRSEEHTSELQSQSNLVCRLLLEKKKQRSYQDCLPRTPRHLFSSTSVHS